MDLLSALRRSRTRRRTGQPTRCVRTMPPRSPDAARSCGRARSRERSELNDHRTGARRRCRPMRCGHPSSRGAETSAADVGSEPCRRRAHWWEHPGRVRAWPDAAAQIERADRAEAGTSEERSSQMTDRSAEPVPSRGGGAVVCVRCRAFEVSAAQRRPRRRSMSDASSSSLSSRRSRRIVPASSRAWQRSFHS